jgi:hypothetical protein
VGTDGDSALTRTVSWMGDRGAVSIVVLRGIVDAESLLGGFVDCSNGDAMDLAG